MLKDKSYFKQSSGDEAGSAPKKGVVSSKITGKVLQQAANTTEAGSIALLLLQATSTGGPGLLASVRYVQRLKTQGGAAPAEPCTQEGQEIRVPYRANYVFLG